jgi:hypothetical protein
MRNKPWLLLSAGLLLLTSSGLRGQEAKDAGGLLPTFHGHSKAEAHAKVLAEARKVENRIAQSHGAAPNAKVGCRPGRLLN